MTKKQKRAAQLYQALITAYPDAHCALIYHNPFELLVATILSAQATDAGVNKATPSLFKKHPTPKSMASVTPQDLEPLISTIGLFRNKAKSIHASAKMIQEDFGGEVPDNMDDLLKLRGVARKTANVVLGNAFGKNEGVVVDTHVSRLANRFKLTKETKPEKIEIDLMKLFPQDDWTMLSHLLVRHGREVCKKRGALCNSSDICKAFCTNVN